MVSNTYFLKKLLSRIFKYFFKITHLIFILSKQTRTEIFILLPLDMATVHYVIRIIIIRLTLHLAASSSLTGSAVTLAQRAYQESPVAYYRSFQREETRNETSKSTCARILEKLTTHTPFSLRLHTINKTKQKNNGVPWLAPFRSDRREPVS